MYPSGGTIFRKTARIPQIRNTVSYTSAFCLKKEKEILRCWRTFKTPTGVKYLLCRLIFVPYRGQRGGSNPQGNLQIKYISVLNWLISGVMSAGRDGLLASLAV